MEECQLLGGVNGYGYLSRAELYDPATGLWNYTSSMQTTRCDHTSSVLLDGKVLVVAGLDIRNDPLNKVELYDPSTKSWKTTLVDNLKFPRYDHTAIQLANGKVLVSGGFVDYYYVPLTTAE